jgi:broad specificity phosphatase PhoE
MIALALLRHAETAWSAEGRIQGRADPSLSDAGRAAVSALVLPEACRGMRIVTSPLARCVQTAAILGAPHAPRERRLIEMDWGRWQGRRLEELRAEFGTAMRENEERGLDFRPDGGESPREVVARVSGWLSTLSEPTLAVTHRGVIRAVFAAASGWDMRGKPPAKLDWSAFHLFRLAADGTPTVEKLNVK